MPCGEDWLSHPLGIVQGFFGEWRRPGGGRGPGGPPSSPSPRGPDPAARRPGGAASRARAAETVCRACAAGARQPPPARRLRAAAARARAAGASHLPDSRLPSHQGYGARIRLPAVIDGLASPFVAPRADPEPRVRPDSGVGGPRTFREDPQRCAEGKSTLPMGSPQDISKLPVCGGSARVLARSLQKLAVTPGLHTSSFFEIRFRVIT